MHWLISARGNCVGGKQIDRNIWGGLCCKCRDFKQDEIFGKTDRRGIMLRIAICDDDRADAEKIRTAIMKSLENAGEPYSCQIFQSGKTFGSLTLLFLVF